MEGKRKKRNFTKKNKYGLEDPPEKYEIISDDVIIEKLPSDFGEGFFLPYHEKEDDMLSVPEKHARSRRRYLSQLEKNAREEAIQNLTKLYKEQIKDCVESGNIQGILDLMKKMHNWKSSFFLYDNSLPKICKVDTCTYACFEGSDYCLNHITKDPSNNLLIECPKCHRIHPKNGLCLI